MAASQENWIKHRAYELWEQEGYPSGKDIEHWERAKLEYATLRPTAAETDVLRNGASAKTTKAAAKPAKNGAAKTAAPKTAAPKAAKKTAKPEAAIKADAKPKVPAAAAAVKPDQTKKRPKKAAAE